MDTDFTEGNGENEGGDMSKAGTRFWDMSKTSGNIDTFWKRVEGVDISHKRVEMARSRVMP